MHSEELYEIFKEHPSVQTDTRKLKPGDIFFALKGDNFNGNSFAEAAIQSGAAYAVIDEIKYAIEGKTILVKNVLQSLQDLAGYHRGKFDIPFLAITGSNGKTTTRELIHAVLSTTFKTYSTEGNLNNHIGIPLTILKIKRDAQIAVIEMGANHIGEIASYCKYVIPTHGLITNCGKAHLEGFGSEEGVRKAKGELFDYLRKIKASAFVMWDYDYLREMSKGIPNIKTYGTRDTETEGHPSASVGTGAGNTGPFLTVKMSNGFSNGDIHTKLVGEYNLPNVLAAIAVGKYFSLDEKDIRSAIENYQPSNSRSQLLKKGTNTIILDAYNANPSSMKLAIENFAKMKSPGKILVLGAMAELGEESLKEHQAVIDLINQHQWKAVALTGGDFLKINHPYYSFDSSARTAEWFRQMDFQNAHILIKGSRSSAMENILE